MKDAVKRLIHAADDNADPLMSWETVRETRGRPTSLHAAEEVGCADVVQYFLDKSLYFHWSLIQSIARRMFMQRCLSVIHSPIDEDSRSHAPAAANLRTGAQRSKHTRENDSELRGQTKHTEKRRESTRSLATTSMDTAKSTENALPEHPAYRATATGARQVTVQVMPSHSNSGGDDIFGCASCRGRLTGCTRCYKFHADGKQKVGFSANGYPTWGFPHA